AHRGKFCVVDPSGHAIRVQRTNETAHLLADEKMWSIFRSKTTCVTNNPKCRQQPTRVLSPRLCQ
ncbi:hypothetical protein NDU88_005021, partial [Pleurodeles waltl]